MEEASIREVLISNTMQVLETAAMVFIEAAGEDGAGEGDAGEAFGAREPALVACMDFTGRVAGCIALAAGEGLGRGLARDMIGLDEEEGNDGGEGEAGDEETDPADALGEILNMIGMITLEALFPGRIATVDPPRAISLASYLEMTGGSGEAMVVRQGFTVEEGVFELMLMVEREQREGEQQEGQAAT